VFSEGALRRALSRSPGEYNRYQPLWNDRTIRSRHGCDLSPAVNDPGGRLLEAGRKKMASAGNHPKNLKDCAGGGALPVKVRQLPVVENQKAAGIMSYNDTGWDLMLKHGDGMKG
jgi:hypothetical protein